MSTIIFYNFILLSSTFFVWLSEKGRTNFDRRFLLAIAFFLVFIPSAIRYDIGTDYLSYVRIFENLDILENYKLKEPGFYYISWVLKANNIHFQSMFATFAFIFTAVAFKAYPRNNAWLLHFLFFSMLWFFSFNGMRQAVALSWCMLATFNFFNKHYLKFIILILIAITFHQTAIFIAMVGVIACIPLNTYLKKYIFPIIFIILIIFTYLSIDIVLNIIESSLNLFGFTRYANYFNNPKHFIQKEFGTGLGILMKILFSLYCILNTNSLLKLNKNYWIIILLLLFYIIGLILANKIVIFVRMSEIFIIAPIVSAYLLLQVPTNKKINKLILILFLAYSLLAFFKLSLGIPNSYTDPKLMPYQTIFVE